MSENWIQQADHAMKRAAQRAREVAERTNTAVVVQRGTAIVRLYPGLGANRVRDNPPEYGGRQKEGD